MGRVVGNPQAQAARPCGFGKHPEYIFLGPDTRGIPGVEFGIEGVEIVVMAGQRHEVLSAGLHIEVEQCVRIEVFRLPGADDVNEARIGRMAIMRQMVVILLLPLQIHVAGIPIAVFGGALRPPMGPDAELRVAEPVRRLIAGDQRVPGRGEWSAGDLGNACRARRLRQACRQSQCRGAPK